MLRINQDMRDQVRGGLDAETARIVAEMRKVAVAEQVLNVSPLPFVPVEYVDASAAAGVPALPWGLTVADMLEGRGFFPAVMPRWAMLPNRWTVGALKWAVLKLSPEEIQALRRAARGAVEPALLGIRTAQRTRDRSPADKAAATCFLLDAWFDFARLGGVGIWAVGGVGRPATGSGGAGGGA